MLSMREKMYGLESIGKLLNSMDADSLLARQMLSAKIVNVLKRACESKRIHIDFQHCVHVECSSHEIIINTTSATIASRLKQIQPTLEKFLFDHGLNLPIGSIRAGKISPLPQLEQYPKDAPRIASPGAAASVRVNAARAVDDDVRKSLERLADALES